MEYTWDRLAFSLVGTTMGINFKEDLTYPGE
jgi:hypothetical protein